MPKTQTPKEEYKSDEPIANNDIDEETAGTLAIIEEIEAQRDYFHSCAEW